MKIHWTYRCIYLQSMTFQTAIACVIFPSNVVSFLLPSQETELMMYHRRLATVEANQYCNLIDLDARCIREKHVLDYKRYHERIASSWQSRSKLIIFRRFSIYLLFSIDYFLKQAFYLIKLLCYWKRKKKESNLFKIFILLYK